MRSTTAGAPARNRVPNELGRKENEKPRAARDVPVGESWVFRDHRSMAEVLAEEGV